MRGGVLTSGNSALLVRRIIDYGGFGQIDTNGGNSRYSLRRGWFGGVAVARSQLIFPGVSGEIYSIQGSSTLLQNLAGGSEFHQSYLIGQSS